MNEHKQILKLIDFKLASLSDDDEHNRQKFLALKELISNQYMFFFAKVDTNVALNILAELGISPEKQILTYFNLLDEIEKSQYTLVNDSSLVKK